MKIKLLLLTAVLSIGSGVYAMQNNAAAYDQESAQEPAAKKRETGANTSANASRNRLIVQTQHNVNRLQNQINHLQIISQQQHLIAQQQHFLAAQQAAVEFSRRQEQERIQQEWAHRAQMLAQSGSAVAWPIASYYPVMNRPNMLYFPLVPQAQFYPAAAMPSAPIHPLLLVPPAQFHSAAPMPSASQNHFLGVPAVSVINNNSIQAQDDGRIIFSRERDKQVSPPSPATCIALMRGQSVVASSSSVPHTVPAVCSAVLCVENDDNEIYE